MQRSLKDVREMMTCRFRITGFRSNSHQHHRSGVAHQRRTRYPANARRSGSKHMRGIQDAGRGAVTRSPPRLAAASLRPDTTPPAEPLWRRRGVSASRGVRYRRILSCLWAHRGCQRDSRAFSPYTASSVMTIVEISFRCGRRHRIGESTLVVRALGGAVDRNAGAPPSRRGVAHSRSRRTS